MWQLCWSRLLWPSHIILMDHQGCNDTLDLLCRPVRAWLSSGDDLVTYCTDVIVPNATVDSNGRGQVYRICEWDFVLRGKSQKGNGLANAAVGFLPLREKLSRQHKKAPTKRQMHTIQPSVPHLYIYIYIYSSPHKWIALMFWAFRQSLSALLCVCVWCNLFPWDGTCSIKSRKKAFSRTKNTHTRTHTHIFTHETWRLGGFELHLDKHFSHKFPFLPPMLPIIYTHAHAKVLAERFHFVSFQLQIM